MYRRSLPGNADATERVKLEVVATVKKKETVEVELHCNPSRE